MMYAVQNATYQNMPKRMGENKPSSRSLPMSIKSGTSSFHFQKKMTLSSGSISRLASKGRRESTCVRNAQNLEERVSNFEWDEMNIPDLTGSSLYMLFSLK